MAGSFGSFGPSPRPREKKSSNLVENIGLALMVFYIIVLMSVVVGFAALLFAGAYRLIFGW